MPDIFVSLYGAKYNVPIHITTLSSHKYALFCQCQKISFKKKAVIGLTNRIDLHL